MRWLRVPVSMDPPEWQPPLPLPRAPLGQQEYLLRGSLRWRRLPPAAAGTVMGGNCRRRVAGGVLIAAGVDAIATAGLGVDGAAAAATAGGTATGGVVGRSGDRCTGVNWPASMESHARKRLGLPPASSSRWRGMGRCAPTASRDAGRRLLCWCRGDGCARVACRGASTMRGPTASRSSAAGGGWLRRGRRGRWLSGGFARRRGSPQPDADWLLQRLNPPRRIDRRGDCGRGGRWGHRRRGRRYAGDDWRRRHCITGTGSRRRGRGRRGGLGRGRRSVRRIERGRGGARRRGFRGRFRARNQCPRQRQGQRGGDTCNS